MATTTVYKTTLSVTLGSDKKKYNYSNLKPESANEKLVDFADAISKLFSSTVSSYAKSVEERIED